ncbi:hypothetical protein PoB_003574300 [Plakobranchus ocellatus]|uniref:Uncharacterized protein n=1 Tax=Plakobranchus ocellatus TaxID=259542 RepID=A0AAV4ARP7_9GAST|nr:hypothetical protein PoB_003574300 [Plakobranchus ocellatus]
MMMTLVMSICDAEIDDYDDERRIWSVMLMKAVRDCCNDDGVDDGIISYTEYLFLLCVLTSEYPYVHP